MALPLPVNGSPAAHADADWTAFLQRRDALLERREMATCNGCDGCGQRCVDGFKVTREEYRAAQAYLATLPPGEVARVLSQNKSVPWPGAEDTGVTFTCCRYRDREKNNCFIYPARPTICRLFGHTTWLPCPIGLVPSISKGSEPLWNEYLHRERRTWDEWDAAAAAALKEGEG